MANAPGYIADYFNSLTGTEKAEVLASLLGLLAQSNSELLVSINGYGVNVLGVENTNTLGYSAFFGRSKDVDYPNSGNSYEHFACGFGQNLGLAGQLGFNYFESSRYNGLNDASMPPPEFTIQTTGGIDPTGGTTLSPCSATAGSTSITVPANSLTNGMTVSGGGIAPGSVIVSGGGTTTLVLSEAATTTVSGAIFNFSTPVYGQYNRMVFHNGKMPGDYAYGIGVYTFTGSSFGLTVTPFVYFDQARGLTHFGTGSYFDKLTFGTAPLNVVDAGTAMFNAVRTGVNTFKMEWASSPARVVFKDGNAGAMVLEMYMDGTKRVNFGGPAKLASYTVATLPTGVAGMEAYVTDGAAALAWGATVSGGGSALYKVWYNGTNWTVVGK